MTGLTEPACLAAGPREPYLGCSASPLSHCTSSRRRRATSAWLSSSQVAPNFRAASCSSSRGPKPWTALEPAHSRGHRRNNWRAAAVAAVEEQSLQHAKLELLSEVLETGRGLTTTAEQRAVVEEKLVAVERVDAGTTLELDNLDGTWLLQYTTAPDVIQILQASETRFLQIGQIFQTFECKGLTDRGIVRNVVRWSIPGILQDDDGATLVVTAKFSVLSPRSIALTFGEVQVGQVEISEGFQALLAPAVIPRTFLNLAVLQFFRNLNVRVPLTQSAVQNSSTKSAPTGLCYYLTYLDRDMLVGRALGSGGIFIFSRTQQLKLP